MAERIRLLPDSVSNQIAAGEVVNRPASVVKELMENAVDAGSQVVTVNFRNGGKDLIQVVDDGVGMSPADARMAFEKHATSKIQDVGDIYKLMTFGFRGEALASIASVAQVELITRTGDAELGCKIEVSGGKFTGQTPVAAAVGSQFLVRNLFFNIPGRKRFLDKSTTEARHITTEYQRVALCHPQVAFKLYDSDSLVSSLPSSSLRQRIVGVVGKSIAPNLLEIKADTSVVKIEGFAGRPAAARQSVKDQFLFVNGRFFRSGYLHKAVVCAYEKLIPPNSQPPYFIYLTIDPDRIDVNVHPQKTEIKFEDSSVVWQIVNAAVRESLAKSGAVPAMDFDMDTSIEIPVFRSGGSYKSPPMASNPDFNPFEKYKDDDGGQRPEKGLSDFFNTSLERGGLDCEIPREPSYEESVLEFIEGDDAIQGRLDLDVDMKAGPAILLGSNYAAATVGDCLCVVDMRRAQEAILYDRYMMMIESGNSVCQQLLFPESIVLSNDDYTLIKDNESAFASLGFDIRYKDEHTIEIAGAPADFNAGDIEDSIYSLLEIMHSQTQSTAEARKDRLATTMARAGARNTILPSTSAAATQLIETLLECSNPAYTPSGLATMTSLSEEEIKKRLK